MITFFRGVISKTKLVFPVELPKTWWTRSDRIINSDNLISGKRKVNIFILLVTWVKVGGSGGEGSLGYSGWRWEGEGDGRGEHPSLEPDAKGAAPWGAIAPRGAMAQWRSGGAAPCNRLPPRNKSAWAQVGGGMGSRALPCPVRAAQGPQHPQQLSQKKIGIQTHLRHCSRLNPL